MATDIGSILPNPYLFNIESHKKKKARLAHEIGAGAKCLKCEAKCQGFELHYWRKICQNCRCGKDDHNIEEDEEDIGKIVIGKLFERPIRTKEEEDKYSYGTDLEIMDENTGMKEKLTFDWVPPGVGSEIAKRYMELLPPDKRPVAGTEAAKERRRQLEQQLPLYDMDETKRCEDLPPEELENFLKYLKVLRTNVAGQAMVKEIASRVPQRSPQSTQWRMNQGLWKIGSSNLHDAEDKKKFAISLNTNPTSFYRDIERRVPEPSRSKDINSLQEVAETFHGLSVGLDLKSSGKTADTKPMETTFSYHPKTPAANQPLLCESVETTSSQIPKKDSQNWIPLPGSTHSLPQIGGIKNLTGPKQYIAKSVEQNILPGQYSSTISDIKANQPYFNKTWAGQRNNHGLPSSGDKGNRHVITHNAVQAPYNAYKENVIERNAYAESSDVNILIPSESSLLKGDAKKLVEHEFSEASPYFCQYCKKMMKPGDVAVICERAGAGKYWHPKCFVCVTCKELLADLIYFYKDGQVYCGRHYTQAADIPRCKACDELIFGETWTRADGFDWHLHHYCCFICDTPLGGMKYIPDSDGCPHCMSCYMAFKAKMCETCENKISPAETRAGFRGYYYHATPDCFCCYSCRKPMIGHKFKMVKNWVFCSQHCISLAQNDIATNPNHKEKET